MPSKKAIGRKLLWTLALTGIFVIIFCVTYLIHIYWLLVDVIFDSAVVDAAVAVVLAGVISSLFRQRLPLDTFELGLVFVIWCMGGYAVAISGPTVLDRSLSFYILEKLQQRGGGIYEEAIPRILVEEYMPEFRLVEVRLTEQRQFGTIEIVDGCVRLTAKGQRLATFSRFVRQNLLAKHRLLASAYTDALVDPFKNSKRGPQGYECE